MLCSEILRSVSGKLQDEDADARRWPWESASGAYSLMDSLNAAVREIVTQRPDATALTEPMRAGARHDAADSARGHPYDQPERRIADQRDPELRS